MRKNKHLLLSDTRDGERIVVVNTGPDEITLQALRFGIDAGTLLTVEKNIMGGPVVVSRYHLEIAIGRDIAKNITVEVVDD